MKKEKYSPHFYSMRNKLIHHLHVDHGMRIADISRLLKMTYERTRQIAQKMEAKNRSSS